MVRSARDHAVKQRSRLYLSGPTAVVGEQLLWRMRRYDRFLAVSSPKRAWATPTLERRSRGVLACAALRGPRRSHCNARQRIKSQCLRAHALHTAFRNRLISKMNHSDPSWAQRKIDAKGDSFFGVLRAQSIPQGSERGMIVSIALSWPECQANARHPDVRNS